VTIFQTLAIFVGGPVVIYVVLALFALVPGRAKQRLTYRPGQSWTYPDQWWAGDCPVAPVDPALVAAGSEGGACGTW